MSSTELPKEASHLAKLPRLVGQRTAYVNSNPARYVLAGKSDNGRRTYISRLNQVARLFQFSDHNEVPWHLLRHEHVQYVVRTLKKKYVAPSTINTTLSTLRSVSREAFNLGQLSGENLTRILNVKLEKGTPSPMGRYVSAGEVASLVRICDLEEDPSGIRDISIIGLMYHCGLRRTEIAKLLVGDFNQSDHSLICHGSNLAERTCWPDAGTVDALLDWLTARNAQVLDDGDPMFTPVLKGGAIKTRAMTDQSIYSMISKRCVQAGVRPCTPQDFRRSFVTNLLDSNVDVLITQRLAGHSTPATTLRYDRRKPAGDEPLATTSRLPYTSPRKDQFMS